MMQYEHELKPLLDWVRPVSKENGVERRVMQQRWERQ